MNHKVESEILNYKQAAELLGVPVGTVYSKVARRELPHIRMGRRLVRFRRCELEQWLKEREVIARKNGGECNG